MEYPPPSDGQRPGQDRNGYGPVGNGRALDQNGVPAAAATGTPLSDLPPPTERSSRPGSAATPPAIEEPIDIERRSSRVAAPGPAPDAPYSEPPSADPSSLESSSSNGRQPDVEPDRIESDETSQAERRKGGPRTRDVILKDLVVQAGLEVLDRDGLGLRAESITYAKVFSYIESEHGLKITRGSVHERIWSSQEDFQLDVLTEAASLSSTIPPEGIPPSLLAPLVELVADLAADEPDARMRCAEFCRRHGHHFLEQQLASESVRQFQALKAAARISGDDPAARSLKDLIRIRSEQLLTNRFRQLCFVFDALGFRGNRALGLSDADAVHLFAQLIQMLIAGAHLDRAAGITAVTEPIAIEADGEADREEEPWTAFSIGMLAFAHLLFEPTDEQPEPADPERLYEQVSRVVQPTADLPEADISYAGSSRRSREELRRLVMTAGLELLLRDGLGLAAESLTYASVFAHIREETGITVHRSTVHGRIWNSQDEFRHDILAEAARYGTSEFFPRLRQALAATPEAVNPDGSINRHQTMLDTTLSASRAQSKMASSSRSFARWQSIKASMLTRPPDADLGVVDDAFVESFQSHQTEFVESFGSMLTAYGLRLDEGLGLDSDEALGILTLLAATLAIGADFDSSGGVEITQQPVALPRIDGRTGTDEWPPLAVGARAFWELLFTWDTEKAER